MNCPRTFSALGPSLRQVIFVCCHSTGKTLRFLMLFNEMEQKYCSIPQGKKCQGLLSTSCHLVEKENEVNVHQRRVGRRHFTFLMVSVQLFVQHTSISDGKIQCHQYGKIFYHADFCSLHSLIHLWDSEGRGKPHEGHKTVSQGKHPVRKYLANGVNHRKIENGEENTFPQRIRFLV